LKRDGSEFLAELSAALLRDAAGKPVGFIAITKDITARKQAEEELRRNYDTQTVVNALLNVSLEDVPLEEILKLSLDLVLSIPWLTFESRGSIFLLEDEPEVLVMKAQNRLAEPIQKACARVPFGRCLCGQAALTQQIQFADRLDDRHETTYEGITPHGHYAVPIVSANKTLGVINLYLKEGHRHAKREEEFLTAVANALSGIIELKRAEERLQQAAEEWRTTFDSITDFISIHDKDFKLTRVNKAFTDIFKMKPEELIGKTCYQVVHRTNGPIPSCPHMKTLETKEPAIADFFEPHLGIHLEEATSPIFDEKGKVVASVHVARDISERKKMEEQLMVADRLASIGELSSGIAHELNNPLTSIIGFSELLLDKNIPNDIKEDLQVINREAQRTSGVVRNLLTFARKHPQEKQSVDVNKVIQMILELRAYEQKVNNIELDTRFAIDLPKITADSFQLQQVFLNIIINAEHFMAETHGRGTLTITTERIGDIIRAAFTDDGPGIPQENLKRVFDPFFTTREPGKGTGLGLSICHGIDTEHGGRIYAKSKVGERSTFFVELPVAEEGGKTQCKQSH